MKYAGGGHSRRFPVTSLRFTELASLVRLLITTQEHAKDLCAFEEQ